MAINKRKVLDTARKYAQKGAKEKALKEYNKLVKADAGDAKLLLEIGDAYRRWGQAEEAIAQYTKVANQYKQQGFDARAVAVLKQILNLDPKRFTAHVTLSELYQRMSLNSEAVASLQTAADGYYREGRRREALELLRKMASLDPSNTSSRLKVADLLQQEGMQDEAVSEYEQVAAELTRQKADDQVTVVQQRILELEPDRVDILMSLAKTLAEMGRDERAEPFAIRALDAEPDPEKFEFVCSLYRNMNNDARLAEVTRALASYYRERGDDDKAREVTQRLPAEEVVNAPSASLDQSEVEEELLEDELLEDDDFLVADDDLAPTGEPDLELELTDPEPSLDEESQDEAPLPEGDTDQLLAEASVYLRYGKSEQAMASLKAVLLQEPGHRGALEKLGEAHSEQGDVENAIECWRQAADTARSAGDGAGFEVLLDRMRALDPDACSDIAPMEDAASEPEPEIADIAEETAVSTDGDTDTDALDLDIDLDIDDDEPEGEAPSLTEDVTSDEADDDEFEVGIELDDEFGDALGAAAEEIVVDEEEEDEGFEVEIDDDEMSLDDSEVTAPIDSASQSQGLSSTSAAQIEEDLEEAEFYIQQGLADEAEAIYQRVLAAAPNHPKALLKMGELAAERGDDPDDTSGAQIQVDLDDDEAEIDLDIDPEAHMDELVGEDETEVAVLPPTDDDEDEMSAPLVATDIDEQVQVEAEAEEDTGGFELDIDIDEEDDLDSIMAAAESAVDGTEIVSADAKSVAEEDKDDDSESFDLAAEFEDDDETDSEGASMDESTTTPLASQAPGSPEVTQPMAAEPLVEETSVELPDAGASAEVPEPLAAAAAADGDSFDLTEALADVFDDNEVDPNEMSASGVGPRSTVEDGFESLFADFKKGVSATLEEGDYETRYDLGIAYREMGLYDDAIGEFQVCLDSPTKRLESLYMMGLCAFDLGRLPDAVSHLEQALSVPDLPGERQIGIHFDLGRVHAAGGDPGRARSSFEAVLAIDPNFPGVTDAMASLDAGETPVLASEDEGYESFDDLMSEARGEEDEPVAEVFESFDDVITEAKAEGVAEEVADEAAAALGDEPEELEPEPLAEADPADRGKKPGRKKKISFV